ncbi:peptide chain release factor aRF-1 [archaeon]|nr:peptide chain release factor aRF-1 [archaeon]
MGLQTKQKYGLKKFIRQLEQIRGRHTELVTVYIPAGYELQKIINHLAQEQGTASNIKDKTTRLHVIDSLEKMIQHLRLFKQTPENGLAVFSGNVSEREGKTDIRVWSIEPPLPLNTRIYRCDQTFKLDILKDMLEERECYGLVIVERKEATIGLLKGTRIEELKTMTSGVPGKFRAGGQSAARFSRLRDEMAKEFYNRIADILNKEFLGMKDMKGILLGGPGPTKEEFLKGPWFNEELRRKVICLQDLGYNGYQGLKELVEKSKAELAKEAITEEREIVQKFLKCLASEPNKAAYGMEEVKKALKAGAVDILLVSEILDEEDVERLEEQAESTGARFYMISTDTMEGEQLRDLGKVAAILRYEMY